ncbi:MAG: AAA family ATPase, partial [Anaerolineae bacterium]|nr:AAA family ATPase [Anaerolineae bacterium]
MAEMMKFITNMSKSEATLDPSCPTLGYDAMEQGITIQELLKQREEWMKGKVIGSPQATEQYTVDQLLKMGLVGIYIVKSTNEIAGEVTEAMKAADLMGESEKNIRNALKLADSMAPCILWIDEVMKAEKEKLLKPFDTIPPRDPNPKLYIYKKKRKPPLRNIIVDGSDDTMDEGTARHQVEYDAARAEA